MNKNYYEILGVSRNVTQEEIRAKYIELVKKYHPDINSDEDATAKAQEINVAYDVLSNEEKRKEYDFKLDNNVQEEKVEEEPFDYEEEINKYTEREKEYAKKLATEKVIKEELLKKDILIKAKLEVLELSKKDNMLEEFYFDKVEEFYDISDKYVNELYTLIDKANECNLDQYISKINEAINIVNDNLQSMPLTMTDAKNYLENEENKERVTVKILADINNLKKLDNKNNLYEQILAGFIDETNYDRYKEIKLFELNHLLNNAQNIKKLAELYGIENQYQLIKNLDMYIEKAKKGIAKLPKNYKKAKHKAEKYCYYNDKEKIKQEVDNLMRTFRNMKVKMSSGIGNIITLKEMKDVSIKYKSILSNYKKLDAKKNRLKIKEDLPLEYELEVDTLEGTYQELISLRSEHITEFFDVFTQSTKRRTVGGLLTHDNQILSGICLVNATAATLSIIAKHFYSPAIPTTIILTSYNAISLKNKYNIYKHNYIKGKMIINKDDDTKEEYKEYCLTRNIKNKSIK